MCRKYCLQLLNFDQLNGPSGGCGFTPTDSNILTNGDSNTGLGVGVYHDYISGSNLLTFEGTDPTSLADWLNNIAQALFPPRTNILRR